MAANSTCTLAPRVERELATTGLSQLWASMIALCRQPGILDLGQGAPDFQGSAVARRAAAAAIVDDDAFVANQYSAIGGTLRLRQALSDYYFRKHPESPVLDPVRHITVTCSATEGIFSACQALLSAGDRAIMFEPAFPWYAPSIRLAGAESIVLRLQAPSFSLPFDDLRAALDADAALPSRTIKMIIVNTPHNPSGAMFSRAQLERLVGLVTASHPECVFLSDEAYEAQVFPHSDAPLANVDAAPEHVRLATLPGMAQRTLTLGTASKLLSLTGWRVGWMVSENERLLAACCSVHSYATFCAPVPLQLGVAAALDSDMDASHGHGVQTSELLARNAHVMSIAVRAHGLDVFEPRGGYFLVVDVSATGMDDVTFCRQLHAHAKIGALPLSVFYASEGAAAAPPGGAIDAAIAPPTNFVRMAVCKTRATMDEACARMAACVDMRSDEFKRA
jgi:aspartate/methionine/tyrosine aminotransferase